MTRTNNFPQNSDEEIEDSPLQQKGSQFREEFDQQRGHSITDYKPHREHMQNAHGQFGGKAPNLTQYNQYNYYNQPPQPEEKKRGGLKIPNPLQIIMFPFKLLHGLQRVISTGCFLIVVLVVLFILFLIFRPVFLWNPVKNFLNEGLQVEEPSASLDDLYEKINLSASEEWRVELTEQEMSLLLSRFVPEGTAVRTEVTPDLMRIMVNTEADDHPLWLVADINQAETGTLGLTNVGFVRFGFPGGINSVVGDRLFSVLDLTQQQVAGNTSGRLFTTLADKARLPVNLSIKSAEFGEGHVILVFEPIVPTGF